MSTTTNHPQFRWSFLHPKYTGVWLVFVLFWLIHWLPRRSQVAIGRSLGSKLLKRNKKRCRIVDINLKLCFPEFSDEQRQAMMDSHFEYLGCAMIDLAVTLFASEKKLKSLIDFDGIDNLEKTRHRHNTILVTYHTTSLDPAMVGLFCDKKTVSMMKRDRNPVTNWMLHRARARFEPITVYMRDQGLRPMVKAIKQKKLCLIIPDEDIGQESNTVFAPFFATQKATLMTTSWLAKVCDAQVIVTVATLDLNTGRYKIQISPPLENFLQGDVDDNAKINATVQKMLATTPEQYMWTFKWFKTQPDGGRNPYDTSA